MNIAITISSIIFLVVCILQRIHINNLKKYINSKIPTDKPLPTIVTKIVKATYIGEIMTIEYDNGTTKKYKGSCIVWQYYPSMVRCSTMKEGDLLDIWSYIKEHGNDYPTAHLSK